MLQLLQQGLRLGFVSRPPLTTSLMPFPLPEASSKGKHLQTEILSMLERGACKTLPGFYSLLLVFPKRTGSFAW